MGRLDYVTVAIQLDSITKEIINIDEKSLTFQGKSGGKTYTASLDFLHTIVPADSKQQRLGREYFFKLQKTDELWWPCLLKDKLKPKWLKVDFNRWKDEDDIEDEENEGPGMDMNMED